MAAWFFLAAGLFIQIPLISAQETVLEVFEQEILPEAEDPYRAIEETFILGGDESAPVSAAGSSVWVIIRMLLVLAFAAAAIYGVVYFIKKAAKPAAISDPFLKVLASSHLGSNRYAHIISVGEKAWLLGSSDGGVNLIGEIEDKDVINAMLLEESKKSAEAGSGRFPDFLSILRRLGTPAGLRNPGADDIRKRRERLKGL